MLGYKNKLIPTLALKKLSFMGNSEKIIIKGVVSTVTEKPPDLGATEGRGARLLRR